MITPYKFEATECPCSSHAHAACPCSSHAAAMPMLAAAGCWLLLSFWFLLLLLAAAVQQPVAAASSSSSSQNLPAAAAAAASMHGSSRRLQLYQLCTHSWPVLVWSQQVDLWVRMGGTLYPRIHTLYEPTNPLVVV